MGNVSNEVAEEYIYTGYCKVKNATTMFTAEYSEQPYGLCLERILGCDFNSCQYNKDCTAFKIAMAKEDE